MVLPKLSPSWMSPGLWRLVTPREKEFLFVACKTRLELSPPCPLLLLLLPYCCVVLWVAGLSFTRQPEGLHRVPLLALLLGHCISVCSHEVCVQDDNHRKGLAMLLWHSLSSLDKMSEAKVSLTSVVAPSSYSSTGRPLTPHWHLPTSIYSVQAHDYLGAVDVSGATFFLEASLIDSPTSSSSSSPPSASSFPSAGTMATLVI